MTARIAPSSGTRLKYDDTAVSNCFAAAALMLTAILFTGGALRAFLTCSLMSVAVFLAALYATYCAKSRGDKASRGPCTYLQDGEKKSRFENEIARLAGRKGQVKIIERVHGVDSTLRIEFLVALNYLRGTRSEGEIFKLVAPFELPLSLLRKPKDNK